MSGHIFKILGLGGLLTFTPLLFAATIYKYVDARGIVTYSDKPVSGAKVFRFKDDMVERFDKQVRLETKRQQGREVLMVRNDLYAPVEVELSIKQAQNVSGLPTGAIRQVIPARQTRQLLVLEPTEPGLVMRYTPVMRHDVGDPGQQPVDGYRYALPWQGGPFRIAQGANGRYSHFTPKGRYAVDIAMPEGTPIIAARSGTVVKIENGQTGRGSHPSGNFVRVLHTDGTMSVYLHLMKGSVSVREGQQVSLGQYLARSGNTGNSTGPHLHFVVQRNRGLAVESIPFTFDRPVGFLPDFARSDN